MSLNVELIRSSFEIAKPLGIQVTEKFYEFLWTDYPESKALFTDVDMELQKRQLLGALAFVVDNVDKPDSLVPFLKEMGKRHVDYGAKNEHYEWVGASLLKTFAFFFEDAWTDELEEQWTTAYGVVADTMKIGAAQ